MEHFSLPLSIPGTRHLMIVPVDKCLGNRRAFDDVPNGHHNKPKEASRFPPPIGGGGGHWSL